MSPIGHNITAFAMATAYMRISGVSWGEGFSSLPTAMLSGNGAGMGHPAFATLVASGMLLGARAPDRLEIPSFNRRTQTRRSVIPHRTLTHWPLFWVFLTALCWFVWGESRDLLACAITSVGLGFCAAAWLHLVMDGMTPMGVPLRSPFGPRASFNLYKTGQAGEWLCILLFVAGCLFFSEFFG